MKINQVCHSPRERRRIQIRDREAIARRMTSIFFSEPLEEQQNGLNEAANWQQTSSCSPGATIFEGYSYQDDKAERSPGTSLLTPLFNLFAPPQIPCLACGKVISERVRDYPELCASCFASIPWIRKPRCISCGRPVGCPDCSRPGVTARSYLMNRSAVAYNAVMREWLAQYKYRGNEAYGDVLSRMMERAYYAMIKEIEAASGGERFRFDVVTFVPVSENRLQERGFNQASHLAYGAAKAGRIPLLPLLVRSRHTEKQSFKSRWERLNDLHDVFQTSEDAAERLAAALLQFDARSGQRGLFSPAKLFCSEKKRAGFSANLGASHSVPPVEAPIRILLVDDVYTTGSTIEACARVLHQVGAAIGRPLEVCSLTWARS